MIAARLGLLAVAAAAIVATVTIAVARLTLPTVSLSGEIGPLVTSVQLTPTHLRASLGSSNMRISVALPLRNEYTAE